MDSNTSRHRLPWTTREESYLMLMFRTGKNLSYMSARMGRTEKAVAGRLQKLGEVDVILGRIYKRESIWENLK